MNKILAIDPGLTITGFAIVGSLPLQKVELLDIGYLNFPDKFEIGQKLLIFSQFLRTKIVEHGVSGMAIETPFLGKNAQTFLKLGYLRGIVMLVCQELELPLRQLSPAEVKKSICKNSQADKEQVARALSMLFPEISKLKPCKHKDVTDAFAIGVCALWSV